MTASIAELMALRAETEKAIAAKLADAIAERDALSRVIESLQPLTDRHRLAREKDLAGSRERYRATQAQTLNGATRNGQEWTGPELAVAARADLTSKQVAEMLGRTFGAVKTVRKSLRDPRQQRLIGTGLGYQ